MITICAPAITVMRLLVYVFTRTQLLLVMMLIPALITFVFLLKDAITLPPIAVLMIPIVLKVIVILDMDV